MDEIKVREAIKMLRREKKECKALLECYEKDHWNYRLLEKKIEACNTAIEALERQLPKKPIEVVGAIYSNSYECKYCGNELEPQDMLGEYCKWCGQKL